VARHRLDAPRQVRPRYGRMAAAGLSLAVTMIALLGGIGVVPLKGADHAPGQAAAADVRAGANGSAAKADTTSATGSRSESDRSSGATTGATATATPAPDPLALPAASGSGRRVVFSKAAQRVWLVDKADAVTATYLVSGSLTDNLQPGKYDVYSRSRWAVGVQDSGVMQYFVRFAHGPHAAIGFHSIPTKNGTPLQTEAQLGTPQSHGCIRQRLADAVRMWDFAAVGTDVVVVP
jgi:hypothetical protein